VSGLDEGAKRKLKTLTEQRDSAVAELEDVKGAVNKMALLVAEKEALEAVAMQLAEERDEAMGEVHKLKSAVDGMTERMRAIEAMLAQEVGELRQQNQALETVAIQLASERDSALNKVADLENALELSCKALAEKVAVQTVAARLAEERDDALKELAELRQLVASLQVDTESGLTPESEVFLKSRLRDVRSNFVNVDKTFDEQPEAVERLVCHLVEEFGAPRQWTRDYLKQFLQSSAGRSNSLSGTGVPSHSLDREAAKMS
jgi:chromosome segregation ATPase